MRFVSVVVAVFAAIALSGCGNSTDPGADGGPDSFIPIDVNTPDTAGEVTDDTGDRDSAAVDSQEDATNVDVAESDADIQTDTGDTGETDIQAGDATDAVDDVPVTPTTPWVHVAVTIEDDVVNGTYLMNPVDGMSYAYNPDGHEFVTAFDRDWNDETLTSLWHLDETTGIHTKKPLTGEVFQALTDFCMDEEWCEFIGYDENDSSWLVLGPRAPAMLKIDSSWNVTQVPMLNGETDQPPNGAISYSHLFAGDRFFVYGYITSTNFSDSLVEYNLDSGDWVSDVQSLPPLFTNCLTLFPTSDVLYSVGGLTTDDGGETSYAFGKVQEIDIGTSAVNTFDLPDELKNREGMACAADEENGRLYVFGGAVVLDNYDERNNTYHNDLWVYEDGGWTLVLADGDIGEFRQYGDNWSLHADDTLPNFGQNIGRMMYDDSADPRLIIVGDVPGSATQMYTLTLSDLD